MIMVCWTLGTLMFWINSTSSELDKGTNYTSLDFPSWASVCVPWERDCGHSAQILSHRPQWLPCSYSDLYLQSTQAFVIKIFKVIILSLQIGLVFLLYQWLTIHMSFPLALFMYLFIWFFIFIMHIASSNPGLSKEKLLAIHLLAIYKSSSSQLPLYLPLNVLSALFLTNILHLISPPLWPLFLLAKSQLSNCCLCQLSWACVQDLRQHMILKKCVLVREPLLFLAYN